MKKTKEELKELQKGFWAMVGMVLVNTQPLTELSKVIDYIDEMFEKEINNLN